jgi:glycosyltransferase involved in cell wall biosynthesis
LKNIEIQVLLATYNGERYLGEFLTSLERQQNVSINLLVSDDGSTDQTLGILKDFEQHFQSLEILAGPRNGPADNFFFLLSKSTGEFIALADQDDIWESNHLDNSVRRITSYHSVPALTFCATKEFDASNTARRIWPHPGDSLVVPALLVENPARGCTMMLNREGRNLIVGAPTTRCIMHDWWILLLIHSLGCVVYEESPEVNYRVHDNNAVGIPEVKRRRAAVAIIKNRSYSWEPLEQLEELIGVLKNHPENPKMREIRDWYTLATSPSLIDRVKLSFSRKRWRSNFLDDVALKLFLLFYRRPNGEALKR